MTTWTPKLEQAIRAVGDFLEAQGKDGVDPGPSIEDTVKSLTARFNTVGAPVMLTAFKEAGLPANWTLYDSNLQQLIDLAKMNNSDAADKIIRASTFETELLKKCPQLAGLQGNTEDEVEEVVAITKKSGLHW